MSLYTGRAARSTSWLDALCATFALFAAVSIVVAGIVWSKQNPRATYWDEAGYFNSATLDYWALRDHRPLRSRIESIVKDAVGQPPAHRAVIALTYFTGPKPALLRFVSLATLLVTSLVMFLAGKRLGGVATGALAALVILVSPAVIASSIRFGTEYPLYFAEAAMLYFLLSHWGRTPARYDQLGLGLALGLGFWSKPSFLTIALPVLAAALYAAYQRKGVSPAPAWIWRSIIIGAVIGAGYWLPLGSRTLRYVHRAAVFDRHSLGGLSPHTLGIYCSIVVSTATGPIVAVLLALVAIGSISAGFGRAAKDATRSRDLAVIGICLCGVVPFTILQFLSANHDMRLLSPVVIPLSLAFAVAATRIAFARVPGLVAVVAAALLAQLAMMLLPFGENRMRWFDEFEHKAVIGNTGDSVATVFAPREQWNWSGLYDLTQGLHLRDPLIAYVGNGDPFNRMQIAYPWLQRDVQITPTWLWRSEYGDIRWNQVMAAADEHSDVVLTAPGYDGLRADKQPHDNAYNAEFAKRLESDPNFKPPVKLAFGPYDPTTVLVFVNKRAGSLTPPPPVDDGGNPVRPKA